MHYSFECMAWSQILYTKFRHTNENLIWFCASFHRALSFNLWFIKQNQTEGRARICKRLRSPGIDSEGAIPPAYVARLAGTANRVVLPACQAGNRFLGSWKCLQIRAQYDYEMFVMRYSTTVSEKCQEPVFWIRNVLIRIWIRIRILLFPSVAFKTPQKISFFLYCFDRYFL